MMRVYGRVHVFCVVHIMKTFFLKITQENGIHARPAGQLVAIANKFKSNITIYIEDTPQISLENASVVTSSAVAVESNCNKRFADAKGIFSIMGLGIKHGDVISVVCDGEDEGLACDAVKHFFENSLAQ